MEEPPWLAKIRGYIDLGMLDEAWTEIEKLPPEKSGTPGAQEMRIIVMLDRGQLDDAIALSEVLCDIHPEEHAGFIQGAYCLHAKSETEDAIELLQSGPESLRDEPVYFYNLACYELALGKPQAAMTWLKRSFEMDQSYRGRALQDPDLESIRTQILEIDS